MGFFFYVYLFVINGVVRGETVSYGQAIAAVPAPGTCAHVVVAEKTIFWTSYEGRRRRGRGGRVIKSFDLATPRRTRQCVRYGMPSTVSLGVLHMDKKDCNCCGSPGGGGNLSSLARTF